VYDGIERKRRKEKKKNGKGKKVEKPVSHRYTYIYLLYFLRNLIFKFAEKTTFLEVVKAWIIFVTYLLIAVQLYDFILISLIRKTNHLCSQLYLLYIHTTTCFGVHRPSSGIAYTKCQEKPLYATLTDPSLLHINKNNISKIV
jgi:hypothetical protein